MDSSQAKWRRTGLGIFSRFVSHETFLQCYSLSRKAWLPKQENDAGCEKDYLLAACVNRKRLRGGSESVCWARLPHDWRAGGNSDVTGVRNECFSCTLARTTLKSSKTYDRATAKHCQNYCGNALRAVSERGGRNHNTDHVICSYHWILYKERRNSLM